MTGFALQSIIHMTAFRLSLRFFTPRPLSALNENAERPEGAWLPDPPQTVA